MQIARDYAQYAIHAAVWKQLRDSERTGHVESRNSAAPLIDIRLKIHPPPLPRPKFSQLRDSA